MTFRESSDLAEESAEDLNQALEWEAQAQFNQEAPIDIPLSESQILEQSTNDLDVNYDSCEFFNESEATYEGYEATLDYLLESMKQLSQWGIPWIFP